MKELYKKQDVLTAIKYTFGCTSKEAKNIFANTDIEYHNLITQGFKSNAKKVFMED